jgi:hypothetical protein
MKLASFLCLIFCAIIFSFEDTSQIEYIDYYDIPCHSLAKSSVDGNSEAGYYLTHDYKNGILEIDLNFLSYCNSVYRDSVIIDGNNIQIVLIDTANATAKCICNHECLFDFNLPITMKYFWKFIQNEISAMNCS